MKVFIRLYNLKRDGECANIDSCVVVILMDTYFRKTLLCTGFYCICPNVTVKHIQKDHILLTINL